MEKPSTINKNMAVYSMFILGILLVIISAIYVSSFLAILGVAIASWGAILLYITPSKHVPLTLLNAAIISATSNIERTLVEANLFEKGRYLPPNLIRDSESSIVFIPEQPAQPLPRPEEVTEEKLLSPNRNFMFITPPGLGLSKLFEKSLGVSFTKTNLDFVQQKLPKLLVESMELAETADLQIQNDTVTLELTGNVLWEVCKETRNLPRTHSQVGCLLSSAVASVLAKASGKVVTIQKDEQSEDGKTTRIEYLIEPIDKGEMMTTPSSEPAEEIITEQKEQITTPIQHEITDQKVYLKNRTGENSNPSVLKIEVDSNALNYLENNGDVFILTDVENPQFSYDRIKNFDADLAIKFVEFVEVCKTLHNSQTDLNELQTGFTTVTYNVTSPADSKPSNMGLYVAKSGFPTVDEWLATLKDKIPECSSGKKTFYLYHVQTIA